MSERLKSTNGEELESVSEQNTEEDYPEFRGKERPTSQDTADNLSVDESRDNVLNAISQMKAEKERNRTFDIEGFTKEKRRLEQKENIPDSVYEIPEWVHKVDGLMKEFGGEGAVSGHSYDGDSHIALSEKHGGDMKIEERKEIYDLLRKRFSNKETYQNEYEATDLMINAIKNSQRVERSNDIDYDEKPESKKIEDEAAVFFEQKAVELSKNMSSQDLREYAGGIFDLANKYEMLADLSKKYSDANNRDEMRRIEARARGLAKQWKIEMNFPFFDAEKESERLMREFYKINKEADRIEQSGDDDTPRRKYEVNKACTLKFLYEQAIKQRSKITGFGNKRRLKKDESLALPESFKELSYNTHIYDVNKLRTILAEYISMQSK